MNINAVPFNNEISANDFSCAICLDEIDLSETEKNVKLACKHIFHEVCIKDWFKEKHTCPLCRIRVEVIGNEALPPEMTIEEINEVPDHEFVQPAVRSSQSNMQNNRRGFDVRNFISTPVDVNRVAAVIVANSITISARYMIFQ